MIGLIVARSKNNVIGKNGNIPWKIKGEQKQFRELTTGNVVIMGRKSYEEIGHPLPNRMNIVVSTTTEYQGDNLVEEMLGIFSTALLKLDSMTRQKLTLLIDGQSSTSTLMGRTFFFDRHFYSP